MTRAVVTRREAGPRFFLGLIIAFSATLFFSLAFLFYRYFKLLGSREVAAACKGIVKACLEVAGSLSSGTETPARFIVLLFLILLALATTRSFMAPLLLALAKRNAVRLPMSDHASIRKALNKAFDDSDIPPVYVLDTRRPVAYTAGFFRPAVFISRVILDTLDSEELESLIVHEAAHIVGRDIFYLWFAAMLRDIMFFLPISHWLVRRFMCEKDRAADLFALSLTRDPVTLAAAIVKVSRMGKSGAPAYSPAFSHIDSVESRVKRLLGVEYRPKYSARSLIASVAVSLIIVMSITGVAFALPRVNHPATAAGCNAMKECHVSAHSACEKTP